MRYRLIALLGSAALLSGCSMFHNNVKSDFACSAPDGTCAPTLTIDDGALQKIIGEKPQAEQEAGFVVAGADVGGRPARIIFPAYTDNKGRLHEAKAVVAQLDDGLVVSTSPVVASNDPDVDVSVRRNLVVSAEEAESVPVYPLVPQSAQQGSQTVVAPNLQVTAEAQTPGTKSGGVFPSVPKDN